MKGDKTKPVPVALSFGFHTILTSIFVLQGDGDLARIADSAKMSFNRLFDQLEARHVAAVNGKNNAPKFLRILAHFKNVVDFGKPLSINEDQHKLADRGPSGEFTSLATTERLAFWNPVIGGGFLLYASYMCSIGLGSFAIDTLGQLRFASHLYNALRPRGLTVPFLEQLDSTFAKTKAVWVGSRPSKGSYGKRFWMAWGMNIDEASEMAGIHWRSGEDFTTSYDRVCNAHAKSR